MNKLKLYGREYSRTQVKNNILKVYKLSSAGLDWYREANKLAVHLSLDNNLSIAQCAGTIAALSPRKSWPANQLLAFDFIEHGSRSGHMSAMINKAELILTTKDIESIENILRGQKIVSFFYNILNPVGPEHVTIDRHAMGIAVNGSDRKRLPKLDITSNQYKFIEQCYMWTAQGLDILPLELQAITWSTYRTLSAN